MSQTYSVQKILKLFNCTITRDALIKAENTGLIPKANRKGSRRNWSTEHLPAIGKRYGFLKPLSSPMVVTFFTQKGGVLKSSLAMNLARNAALHGTKTCLLGLDSQCDITNAMGHQLDLDEAESLEDAMQILSSVYGLTDIEKGRVNIRDAITTSDIPNLDLIPETPDLVSLDKDISTKNMRDFWLRDNIIDSLKKEYDLIVIDCAPSFSILNTNALIACDVLISPLECAINNYRNYLAFKTYIEIFKRDTRHDFAHIYVPTKFKSTRRLSSEIKSWYLKNVPGCLTSVIRESVASEEAIASHLSLPEYAPSSVYADEMKEFIQEAWTKILHESEKKLKVDGRKRKSKKTHHNAEV